MEIIIAIHNNKKEFKKWCTSYIDSISLMVVIKRDTGFKEFYFYGSMEGNK